ncbi:Rab-GAP/TBC domain protein [Purpureocillium lavendulum]|uniref:Rab-GAP/TBC domain protein n=1 Tax=Purpureocillium lavendulum TaxID=1247861 RepID=A0AB34G3Q6_9HYPO|nr:Rab-GAP/TBC domain protein [Purpureocillium lavendulum]
MPSPMCGRVVAPEIGSSLGQEDHVTITLCLVSASSSEYQTGAVNSSTPSNMDEHEAARLLRLLEEAKSQLNQEQRRREEADQRLQEEQQRREEERKRREEADRQRDEANRQREAAEALAGSALPQTVPDYLEACHQLSLAIDIVTDKSLTTQGEPTKPAGRKFPRQIIPWDGFAQAQEETWNQLAAEDAFFTDTICPSANQLDYIASLNRPISSEIDLRNFERDTVEVAVQRLLDQVYESQRLRNDLNMQGTVTFENHTNLGPDEESVSESLEGLTIQATATTGVPRRRPRGRGNRRADQFCIYRNESGRSYPSLAIEYKAPHKLSREQIVAGLGCEIRPQHDVINAEGEGFMFESTRLCAAVITQLFSYMLGLGTSYGYICTGEVFIFLHIPTENPSIVYYSTQVPNLDVVDDDETRLHRTAVAQVFAFVLRAARADPPPQSWFDAAEKLGTWAVEYEKMLEDVPVSARVEEVDASILRHEARMYDELRAIQGIHVPVSLGTLDLALPYYFDGRICTNFLFLSYAGCPLNHMNDTVQPGIVANVSEALTAIHKRGVLHRDAEPRNLLCDGNTIMVVDFEKADIGKRPALEGISPNANSRKRKRNSEQRAEFQLQELENTRCSVTRILQQRGMACT